VNTLSWRHHNKVRFKPIVLGDKVGVREDDIFVGMMDWVRINILGEKRSKKLSSSTTEPLNRVESNSSAVSEPDLRKGRMFPRIHSGGSPQNRRI